MRSHVAVAMATMPRVVVMGGCVGGTGTVAALNITLVREMNEMLLLFSRDWTGIIIRVVEYQSKDIIIKILRSASLYIFLL